MMSSISVTDIRSSLPPLLLEKSHIFAPDELLCLSAESLGEDEDLATQLYTASLVDHRHLAVVG